MPVVMDADRVHRSLVRIAHEILERNRQAEDLAFVGIRARGVPIAERLAKTIKEISGVEVPTGALDITLYRDDVMHHAAPAIRDLVREIGRAGVAQPLHRLPRGDRPTDVLVPPLAALHVRPVDRAQRVPRRHGRRRQAALAHEVADGVIGEEAIGQDEVAVRRQVDDVGVEERDPPHLARPHAVMKHVAVGLPVNDVDVGALGEEAARRSRHRDLHVGVRRVRERREQEVTAALDRRDAAGIGAHHDDLVTAPGPR